MAGMIIIRGDTAKEVFELLNGLCASQEAMAAEKDTEESENQDIQEQEVLNPDEFLEPEEIDPELLAATEEEELEAESHQQLKRVLSIQAAKDVLNGTQPVGPAGLVEILITAGGWTVEQIARMLDVDKAAIHALLAGECYPYVEQAFRASFPAGNVPVRDSGLQAVPSPAGRTRRDTPREEGQEFNGAIGKMTPKRRTGKKPFRPEGPVDLSGCTSVKDAVETAIAHWGGHVSSLANSAGLDFSMLKKAIVTNKASTKIMTYLVANKFKAAEYAEGKE